MLGPGPLSHSSACTLLGCEQKYYYYKIEKVDPDPDYVKSDALSIGSAVHHILEHSKHQKPASLSAAVLDCIKDPDIGLDPQHTNLVAAMVLKYSRLNKHMEPQLKVIEVEFRLETEEFIGFVDAILQEPNGKWWICDVKTWKSLMPSKLAEAPMDPQLNLYASHAPLIAKIFNLDPELFAGCRWRVVTKTTAKQKAGETDTAYIKRLADKNLKAFDIAIPKDIMKSEDRKKMHKELYWKSVRLKDGDETPVRNFNNCFSFFSPCEYWSKCHGGLFSDHTPVSVTSL